MNNTIILEKLQVLSNKCGEFTKKSKLTHDKNLDREKTASEQKSVTGKLNRKS